MTSDELTLAVTASGGTPQTASALLAFKSKIEKETVAYIKRRLEDPSVIKFTASKATVTVATAHDVLTEVRNYLTTEYKL